MIGIRNKAEHNGATNLWKTRHGFGFGFWPWLWDGTHKSNASASTAEETSAGNSEFEKNRLNRVYSTTVNVSCSWRRLVIT